LTREHIPLGKNILKQIHRRWRWGNFRNNKWWKICMTRASILRIKPFVTQLQSATPFGIPGKYMKRI